MDFSATIHPNPALDQFWLSSNGPALLQITDLQGQVLLEQKVETQQQIDISGLPKGLLICTLNGIQAKQVIKLLKLI